jgi:diguanylate cyclase (GGDEF)-like protein
MRHLTEHEWEAFIERLNENDRIAHQFFELQASVLSIHNFRDFFERLLLGIEERFKVPYVWVSLITSGRVTRLVKTFVASEDFLRRLNFIDREAFLEITGGSHKPMLANSDLNIYNRLLPFGQQMQFRSFAMVPISFDGKPAGSLNFADTSPERYEPGIDTGFLEQLGLIVSICLSNVAAHEELNTLAFKDPLTGLLNRRAMESALKREYARAKRYLIPMSLVFIDLDHFKKINDTYGHDYGDDLLRFVAASLTEMARESDIIARFAGDEFMLILPGTSTVEAEKFVKRVKTFFNANSLDLKGNQILARFTHGIASVGDVGVSDPGSLIKKADEKLYEAKETRPEGRYHRSKPSKKTVHDSK